MTFNIKESSKMFFLSVLWQEECAVMLSSSHHKEEKFLDSQFSITNRPFLGVSYCLQGVETPGTFGLAIKEQERFSFMLDSQLLIFDRLCLDSWNLLQYTASPSFETNDVSDFENLDPLFQDSPPYDFRFDTDEQNRLFQSIDSENFDMNFNLDIYNNNQESFYNYPIQDYNNNSDDDFVQNTKKKRKKKASKENFKKRCKYKTKPLRPFTPFNGSAFRMWTYGAPEPNNITQLNLHKKFREHNKRPKNCSYRCYYCILTNQACDSAPGNGKCTKCIEKSSIGKKHEIICMFDEFTFKER